MAGAAAFVAAQPPAPVQDLTHPQGTNAGIFAFTGRCAGCHDSARNGAQDRYTLNRRTPEEVLASISTGIDGAVRPGARRIREARALGCTSGDVRSAPPRPAMPRR